MIHFTKHATHKLALFQLSKDIIIKAINMERNIKVITVLLTSKRNIIISRERRGRWIKIM